MKPDLGADLLQELRFLAENRSADINPGKLADLQEGIDLALAERDDRAAQVSWGKTNEIKEIMVAVAATAAAVGQYDQRYSSEFSGLCTRLRSIAGLEDLSDIRRLLVTSATELQTIAKKLAEEVEQSLSQLRDEVDNHRARLTQLEKRQAVDALTGLVNRCEVQAQIEELASCTSTFCLAVLDLDGFKRINDIHGHVAGDNLLKQFAAEVKARLRVGDVVGRWGGDEFIVIVDSDFEEAQLRLDRICERAFRDYTISNGTDFVQVTISASVGIAAWNGKESAVELLARADKYMYAEKKLKDVLVADSMPARARSIRRTSHTRRPSHNGCSAITSIRL